MIQYTKGAPDEVLKRCVSVWKDGREVPMNEELRREILEANKRMADQALRVLCGARRSWKQQPETWEAEYLEQQLCYLGLSGMIDPVRPEVIPAIRECREAGIRPVMITGDHKDTAAAIARQLGIIDSADQAITGAELDEFSDRELDEKIEQYSVYARVQPEHKVRIVRAWKSKGKITAMTGDGVNDAPSIKSADIGIGMGITGTDVTKNVADMCWRMITLPQSYRRWKREGESTTTSGKPFSSCWPRIWRRCWLFLPPPCLDSPFCGRCIFFGSI